MRIKVVRDGGMVRLQRRRLVGFWVSTLVGFIWIFIDRAAAEDGPSPRRHRIVISSERSLMFEGPARGGLTGGSGATLGTPRPLEEVASRRRCS